MTGTATAKYAFETGIYRPPSEGGSYSLLVRVTRNCPWNRCTFCGMYKGERFAYRPLEEVKGDIDAIAALCKDIQALSRSKGYGGLINRESIIALLTKAPDLNHSPGVVMILDWLSSGARTAFLQDANSLALNTHKLVCILRHLRKTFPTLTRVTSYARSKTLARKRQEELAAIHAAGLDRLHVGLETGDDSLLADIKKGASSQDHITGGKKAIAAGFQVSEYWMPGLGGKAMWRSHAIETARVLSEINPHYIRSRPFFPSPGTERYEAYQQGEFQPLSAREQLIELKLMLEQLDVDSRVCFDHLGNYWVGRDHKTLLSHRYEGYRFPEEKAQVVALIDQGIDVQRATPQGPPPWLMR